MSSSPEIIARSAMPIRELLDVFQSDSRHRSASQGLAAVSLLSSLPGNTIIFPVWSISTLATFLPVANSTARTARRAFFSKPKNKIPTDLLGYTGNTHGIMGRQPPAHRPRGFLVRRSAVPRFAEGAVKPMPLGREPPGPSKCRTIKTLAPDFWKAPWNTRGLWLWR